MLRSVHVILHFDWVCLDYFLEFYYPTDLVQNNLPASKQSKEYAVKQALYLLSLGAGPFQG